MGMTIEEAITRYKNNAEYERTHGNLQGCLEFRQLVEWLRKYQKMQADYENRLKADKVAALKELQLEIEEIETGDDTWELAIKDDCNAVIQKKIDALEYDLERGNDGD